MDSKGPTITQQPMAQPMQYKSETAGSAEWQNDLFDCFSGADNLCLKATFCSCFVYGKIVARGKDPSLQGYERFNGDCIGFAALNACCGLGWVLSMMNRGQVRERYGIKGDGCTDCLTEYFCTCCSLIQVEKEIIVRSQQGNGGYVAPQGMVAGPM